MRAESERGIKPPRGHQPRALSLTHGNCTGRQLGSGGTIFVGFAAELILNSVSVTANWTSHGGGVYAVGASAIANACTLDSNFADVGGVLFADSSVVTMSIVCIIRGRGSSRIWPIHHCAAGPSPCDPYRHALAMWPPQKARPFSFLNYLSDLGLAIWGLAIFTILPYGYVLPVSRFSCAREYVCPTAAANFPA